MRTITESGTRTTNGTTRTGGITIIRIGCGITIATGSRHIQIGAPTMATMTKLMCGTTAPGGMTIIRIGSATIIMTGYDGMSIDS